MMTVSVFIIYVLKNNNTIKELHRACLLMACVVWLQHLFQVLVEKTTLFTIHGNWVFFICVLIYIDTHTHTHIEENEGKNHANEQR